VLYLRDGLFIYCYSVSVIIMLLRFIGVLVSFLFAACSHFGCFLQWFCMRGRMCVLPTGVHFLRCPECVSIFVILNTFMKLGVSAMSLKAFVLFNSIHLKTKESQ
jgi:hypothetical protein